MIAIKKIKYTEIRKKDMDKDTDIYLYVSKDKKSLLRVPLEHRAEVVVVTDIELTNYANGVEILYALHISALKVYDKPKELGEFRKLDKEYHNISEANGTIIFADGFEQGEQVTHAPQSYIYVETPEWVEV